MNQTKKEMLTGLFLSLCDELELNPDDVRSKRRKTEFVLARHIFVYLVVKRLKLPFEQKDDDEHKRITYEEIGEIVNRKHSNTIQSYGVMRKYMSIKNDVRFTCNNVEVKLDKMIQEILGDFKKRTVAILDVSLLEDMMYVRGVKEEDIEYIIYKCKV